MALAAALTATPAQALIDRAWLSRNGVDGPTCGPAAAPCRSLQYVHDNIIAAGGVIDIMDAGGFGSIAITKSLAIVNDGVGVAGVLAATGGNGVTIDTANPTDKVYLRGLTIEGAAAGSAVGVLFKGVGDLTIEKCVVRRFIADGADGSATGIYLRPSGDSTFTIAETTVLANGAGASGGGVIVETRGAAVVAGVLDHVSMLANRLGLHLRDSSGATGRVSVSARNSVAAHNANRGFAATSGGAASIKLTLRGVLAQNNQTGVFASKLGAGAVAVKLSQSVVTENTTGVGNFLAQVFSYGDNLINGNTTDVDGALSLVGKQ